MAESDPLSDRKRIVSRPTHTDTGHQLVQVVESLPGAEPTDAAFTLSDGPTYESRYWRCRHCGTERTTRTGFIERCAAQDVPTVLSDGGYSVAEPRTRRALTEDMAVNVARMEASGIYRVEGASGLGYRVDLTAWTCSCPDYTKREPPGGCKHLRRVDLAVLVGNVPGPDGEYTRSKPPQSDSV
ncbi:hypothetical protein ACKVMT_17370 [Halobacteriales archaeon Cl-PHB]